MTATNWTDEDERAAADLWRRENPDKSAFACDAAEKDRYRARVRTSVHSSAIKLSGGTSQMCVQNTGTSTLTVRLADGTDVTVDPGYAAVLEMTLGEGDQIVFRELVERGPARTIEKDQQG